MKTLQNFPTPTIGAHSKNRLLGCLFIAAMALGVSGSATAAAPEPYIVASRMSYQLENQSFNLVVSLPFENSLQTLDSGEPNPDYAFITSCHWEVSTDNGASWRKIGSAPGDSDLYISGTDNPLTILALKPAMTGWQYSATVTISCGSGQTTATRTAVPQKLNVKPSPLKWPSSLTFDGAGNLYVADRAANVIWKITGDEKVSVFAGSPSGEKGTTDGTGTKARFNFPQGIAWQGGKFYVADSGNNAIRMITSGGAVTTLAGHSGLSGDYGEGTKTNAWFYNPRALTVDSSGNVYVVDSGNNVIRKITSAGVTSRVAGEYYRADSGNYWTGGASARLVMGGYYDVSTSSLLISGVTGTLSLGMTATFNFSATATYNINDLKGGAISINGSDLLNLYNTGTYTSIYDLLIAMQLSGSTLVTGTDTIFQPSAMMASPETPPATGSAFSDFTPDVAYVEDVSTYRFKNATGITLSADGKLLYVADTENNVITSISLSSGKLSVLDPDLKGVSDDPLADGCDKLAAPIGLRSDKNGNLYLADSTSSRIVKMTASNPMQAQTIAGLVNAAILTENGAGLHLQMLYPNSFQDGTTSEALFNVPSDIAIDAVGNIYVADSANAAIRKITQSGTTVTVSTLMLELAPNDTSPASGDSGSSGSGGGGGAPSAWFLLALGALAALRLRRR